MQDYMPYMQAMGLPSQYCNMMETSQNQLELMYPKIYYIIYPHVKCHCDMFDSKYGMMSPSREQLEAMVDDIYCMLEADVEISIPEDDKDRQFVVGGRRLIRDLASILLIRELLLRRRPYPYSYPYPYGGYPGYYGGVYGMY